MTIISCILTVLQYMAATLHGECSLCTYDEKYKVASVIVNRTNDKHFPSTIKGVIDQQYQFQGVKTKYTKDDMDICMKAMKNPIKRILYFHHKNVTPSWSKIKTLIYTEQYHLFYGH